MAASAKDVLKATGCKPNTRLLKGTHKKVSPVAIVVKYLQIFVEGQGEEGDGEGQRETRGDSGLVCTHARAHRLCVCLAHKAAQRRNGVEPSQYSRPGAIGVEDLVDQW